MSAISRPTAVLRGGKMPVREDRSAVSHPTHLAAAVLGWTDPTDTSAGPLDRIRIASVVDEVHDRLVAAMALGHLAPGDRLPAERELAAQLGVARSTIRDAVARLRDAGLVDVRRGRSGGTFVTRSWGRSSARSVRRALLPNWETLEQLFDMRTLTESLVARTAALRRSDDHVDVFRDALTAFDQATTPEGVRAADASLHAAIAEATGNRYLLALSHALRQQVNLGFAVDPYSPRSHDQAREEHLALVTAVVDGAADEAAQLARRHFLITEEAFRRTLQRSVSRVPSGRAQRGARSTALP